MAAIESPCTRICALDRTSDLCLGCGRSLAEIAGWMNFSADERRRIMGELPQRVDALKHRRARSDAT